jgi:hypothetical protein
MIPLPNISIAAAIKAGIFLFAAFALALLVHDRNHWKSEAGIRQQQLAQTKAAFDQTVAGYRAAAAQARAADAANAARVKAEQAAINQRTANEFETRIAAARADAQRLRHYPSAAADSGDGGSAPVPSLPASTGGAAQSAGQDRLSDTDKLIATEQAIQLDELIKWVRAQAAVDPNTVAPAEAGASGRECATEVAATPTEMPACAGMTVHANVH